MKQRLSIHTYLILFLFFILIPLLILSVYQGNRFADQKRTYYLHQSKLRNEALKYFVQQIISNDVKLVELVDIAMHDGAKRFSLAEKQYLLDRLNQNAGIFHGIYVANQQGISEIFSPQYNALGQKNAPKNYSDRDYYKEAFQIEKPVISKLQKGKSSNAPAIQIAIPYKNEYNEITALTTANVHIDILEKKAKEMINDDPRFRIVMTDHIYQVIFDSMHQSSTYRIVDQIPLFQKFLSEGGEIERTSTYVEKDEKNNEMLVYASDVAIRNRSWKLYVIFPKLVIEDEALEARNITFMYSSVIVLAILLISYLIALRISKGTAKILNFVQEIGQGSADQVKINDLSFLAAHEGQMMIEALRDTVKRLEESAKVQKKAEDTVRVNDKLATIGTMVAGIAHEINNPLSYLRGNLDFSIDLANDILEEKKQHIHETSLPLNQSPIKTEVDLIDHDLQKIYDIKDALEEALIGVERVSEIVKSLLSLSRKDQSKKMSEVSIKDIVDACIRVANSEIKKRAILEVNIPILPLVKGNESQLGQVILNLLMNAAQAIPEGKVQENKIRVKAEIQQKQDEAKLVLSISDTGSGIKPELMTKIFDPFFTTKPVGKGTGLGLSICFNIIKNHQGEILVDSTVGEGTTFSIVLPIADQHNAHQSEITPSQEALTRLKTPINFKVQGLYKILIVDDMIEVAKGIQRQLSNTEYDCVITESPIHALSLLKDHDFHCIISDLMMPELNGDLFYLRIKKEFPLMANKMFFVSGGIICDDLELFLKEHQLSLVPKPVDLNELLKQIKEIQKKNQA